MLFRRPVLEGLAAGRITLAFRRWRRPSVKAGGSLLTPIGRLAIEALEPIEPETITEAEAQRAGYATRAELLRELAAGTEGRVYRIILRLAGPDPRDALRTAEGLDEEAMQALLLQLQRLDRASPRGAWTAPILHLTGRHPGRRAAELGLETAPFKRDVRKLKVLGLTESLEVGYMLSPRGKTLLQALQLPSPSAPSTSS